VGRRADNFERERVSERLREIHNLYKEIDATNGNRRGNNVQEREREGEKNERRKKTHE
jgi:hypothetical protein